MWQIALDNYYFPGLQSSSQSAVGKFNICQLCQKLLFLVQKFFLSEADLQVKSSFRESGHAFPFIMEGVKSFAGSGGFRWQLSTILYMSFQRVSCGITG